MKIGIDLHGVIDRYPKEFRLFARMARKAGAEIWIISGPTQNEIKQQLDRFKWMPLTHYNNIISVVDYLKDKDTKMWLDYKDTWWASDEEWWSSKANICKENGIELMIDDKEGYKPYFDKLGIAFFIWK